MDDEIKKAEARGYSRGYQAGKARKRREVAAEAIRKERQAFLDRAYLALLPTAMDAVGWTIGGKKIITGDDHIELAVLLAKRALKQRPTA